MFVPLYLLNHNTSYNKLYILLFRSEGSTSFSLTTIPRNVRVTSYTVGLVLMDRFLTEFPVYISAVVHNHERRSSSNDRARRAEHFSLLQPLVISSLSKVITGCLFFSIEHFDTTITPTHMNQYDHSRSL